MKNLKQKIILCAGIILTGFIAACSNFFTDTAEFNAGTGNVLIKISGGNERTILPAAVNFSRYAIEVVGAENNPALPADLSGITGNGVSITLPAGEYTVTVKAYRSSGENEYLVAQGSKTVTVSSGSKSTAVVIDLKPFIGEENGFFSYNITLPFETNTAVLNLKALNGDYDEKFNLIDSAVSSALIELPAGYYEIFISLKKGAMETGEYAVVHIYSGMETGVVLDMSNDFAAINLEALIKVIGDAENELAKLESGDVKISNNGEDVLIGWLWVTQDAVDALRTVLAAAQDLVENPPAKQRPVNAAQQALERALAEYEPQQGTKFDNGSWTGLITEVETPVTFTVNNSEWTLLIPLANINLKGDENTYTVSNGTVTLKRGDDVFAVGVPSAADNTLTLTLTTAVLGVNKITLTKGTAAAPEADIEYLYSGIWTNTGSLPAITYISADKWTFSLPYKNEKANGTFIVYDRKAAFYETDGTFFAVGKLAVDQAELTGNTLTIYPVTGGSVALTLNPYTNPYIGNWQGGNTIGGTLFINVTTWSLENDGGVLAEGEYVWNGNEAYFISNGARFATGTINEAKNELTVAVNNSVPAFGGLEQVFTLIPSPFIGNWKGTVAIIVTVNAAVTTNTYTITSIAGNTNGQYIWRTVNNTTKGLFYSNGYSYGTAALTSATKMTVNLDEPISVAGLASIKSLTLTKQ